MEGRRWSWERLRLENESERSGSPLHRSWGDKGRITGVLPTVRGGVHTVDTDELALQLRTVIPEHPAYAPGESWLSRLIDRFS